MSYQEQVIRASIQALRLAMEMGRQGTSLNRIDNPLVILEEVQAKINQLITWETTAFFLMEEHSSDLTMALCTPAETGPRMDRIFERLVEERTLSLVLQRPGHFFIGVDGSEVFAHAMSTVSRCRGLFLGIPGVPRKIIPDASLAAISIIMQSAAQTLESYELYRLIRDINADLKDKVTRLEREIAERRRLESKLRHAHKMEALGTLAGGVAHDFNNLLQVISGYAQLLLARKTEKDRDYAGLAYIQQSCERGKTLIRQLLAFSRKAEAELRPMDLNQEVLATHKVLVQTIPRMVRVELDLDSALWPINGDPMQLQQILFNLCNNAVDAMSDQGRMTIGTKNLTVDQGHMHDGVEMDAGKYVQLVISDTGCGMSEEVRQKVFDPFFTTKDVGKGTGLGLASVYGIIKSLGGYIFCSSTPGQGSTFKIFLPALTQEQSLTEPKSAAMHLEGGRETILVVDDEEVIRELTADALKSYGYSVLLASSGEEALQVYAEQGQAIHLVVLDLNMPGMGGYRCLQELLHIDPEALVLIASGYSVESEVQQTLESGAVGFIGKPYQLQDLMAKVREVLDGKKDNGE